MLEPKETVSDRIEQSFVLFKSNFGKFLLPILFYKIASLLIMSTFIYIYFKINPIDVDFLPNSEVNQLGALWWLYESIAPFFIKLYTVLGVIILYSTIYSLLYIWFWIWLIRSIKQWFNWEDVTPKENLFYGFRNISNSFKTYWYVFAYVYLIPAIIFIVWWILLIMGLSDKSKNGDFIWIGVVIIVFSVFMLMIFWVLRWVRSYFSISSAVDKNEFSKDNFRFSIKITKDNWLRIVWNFILVWIIIWFISSVFSGIIWIIGFAQMDFGNILNYSVQSISQEIGKFFESFWEFSVFKIISKLLSTFLTTIMTVFMAVFTYIFFKRLEFEGVWEKETEDY